MALGHEKLDVYHLAIAYVAWVFERSEQLSGLHRHARDQWLRASQSIPLNIAEGNGKTAESDRRRYFEIARDSALECAAIQDVLVVGKSLEENESRDRKVELDRMAAMLSCLGKRGYIVEEEPSGYGIDPDFDSDFDPDKMKFQSDAALNDSDDKKTWGGAMSHGGKEGRRAGGARPKGQGTSSTSSSRGPARGCGVEA